MTVCWLKPLLYTVRKISVNTGVIKLFKVRQQLLITHLLEQMKINLAKASLWCAMSIIERCCQCSLWI